MSHEQSDTAGAAVATSSQLRSRIFETARQLLAEKGLAADINEVITRAGVGAGSVYRNFANKEALFRAVAEEMVQRTRAGFIEIASRHRDARTCVALTMKLGFQNVHDYGRMAIELFGGAHPLEYRDLFDRRALEAFFRALIERGIKQGHFRPDVDLEHAVGCWFALTAPAMFDRMLQQRTVEEIAGATTRFFLAGLSGEEWSGSG